MYNFFYMHAWYADKITKFGILIIYAFATFMAFIAQIDFGVTFLGYLFLFILPFLMIGLFLWKDKDREHRINF